MKSLKSIFYCLFAVVTGVSQVIGCFLGCSVALHLTATSVMMVSVFTLMMSLMRFSSLNFG